MKRSALGSLVTTSLMAVILLGMMCLTHLSPAQSTPATDGSSLEDLPLMARYAISGAVGRDITAYAAATAAAGVDFRNESQGIAAHVSDQGMDVVAGDHHVGLTLERWGRGTALDRLARGAPRATENRVTIRRGPVTEWYVNGPLGLQQGFTLDRSPTGGTPDERVVLALSLRGDLTPRIDADECGLSLHDAAGAPVLRYGGLLAVDATGRRLDVRFTLEDTRVFVHLDDDGAEYPVVVDPWIQASILSSSDGVLLDRFGASVGVYGNTVVVGAPHARGNQRGAAYVFIKPSSGWTYSLREAAKLVASSPEDDDNFGDSVAIFRDTIIVGAREDGNKVGEAYVFKMPRTGWSGQLTETAKLLPSDGAGSDRFGLRVAVSSSGGRDLVVVTSYAKDFYRGAAYVFAEPRTGWASPTPHNETAKLEASDRQASDSFGWGVDMFGDTIVIGAPFDDDRGSNSGSVYVFEKPSRGWQGTVNEVAKLFGKGIAADDRFGASVAVDAGASQIVAGAALDDDRGQNAGAAFVFNRPVTGWLSTLESSAKLLASDGAASDFFGSGVTISGDMIVVGAPRSAPSPGKAYFFVKPATGWRGVLNEGEQYRAPFSIGIGYGRALDLDGTTLAGGAVNNQFYRGRAYVHTPRPPEIGDVVISSKGTVPGVYYTNMADPSLSTLGRTTDDALSVLTRSSTTIAGVRTSGGSALVQISSSGTVTTLATFVGQSRVREMDWDQTGDIILGHFLDLLRYDTASRQVTTLTTILGRPEGVTRDLETGNFVATHEVLTSTSIVRYDRQNGTGTTMRSLPFQLQSIAYLPDTDQFVVGGFSHLAIMNRIGTVATSITLGATSVTYDQTRQHIYAARGDTIHKLDNTGTVLSSKTYPGADITGIDIFGDRNVVVVTSGTSPGTNIVIVAFRHSPNALYCLAVSSGLRPGIPLPSIGKHQHLLPDAFYFLTTCNNIPGLTSGFVGNLDSNGIALASFEFLAGLPRGFTFYVSAGIVNASLPGGFDIGNTACVKVE